MKQVPLDRESIWIALADLGEPRLVGRVLEEVMVKDPSLTLTTTCVRWIAKQGWPEFSPALILPFAQTKKATLGRIVSIFRMLATMRNQSGEHKLLCRQQAAMIIAASRKIQRCPTFRSEFRRTPNNTAWQRHDTDVDFGSLMDVQEK